MKLSTLSVAVLTAIATSPALSETTELNDILVMSPTNSEQSIRSVTSNLTVITAQEIEEKHYQTIQEALQVVPGINLYNSGGPLQTTLLQVRGSSNGQVLIMVDGVSINDPSSFGANLNTVALQDIDRIEIVKGPQAGVWGANAAAGVVNIITKQATQGGHAQVNIERGSWNTQKLATTLSAANDHADFVFSLSDTSSDGYSSVIAADADSDDSERDGYSQTDINFKLGLNLNTQHRLETSIKKNQSDFDYDAYAWPNGYDPEDAVSHAKIDSELRKLQYRYQQDGLSARLYLSNYQIERAYVEPFVTGYYEGESTEKGGVVNYEYLSGQSLTAGAVLSESKGVSDYYGLSKAEYQSTGLFVTNTNLFNNGSLIISESLRNDQYDNDFDDKLTGKIGIKYRIKPDIYLGANYGTAYNAPSLYDYTHSVAGLQPETTEGYEINLGAYGLEVSYYDNDVTDLIGYNSLYEAYNEDGTSSLSGFEVRYARYFKQLNTDFKLAYDTLTAKNAENQWLGRRPQDQVSLQVMYDGFANTQIGIQSRYVGQMYDQNDQQGQQIGDYFTTNLTASYALNKGLNMYVRVVNVFGEDYTSAITDASSNNVYSNGGMQTFVGIRGNI